MLEALTELIKPLAAADPWNIELLLIAAVIWVLLGYLLRTRAAAVVIPISIFVLLLVVILDLLSSRQRRSPVSGRWWTGSSEAPYCTSVRLPELRQGLMKLDLRDGSVPLVQACRLGHRSGHPSVETSLPIRQGMIAPLKEKRA